MSMNLDRRSFLTVSAGGTLLATLPGNWLAQACTASRWRSLNVMQALPSLFQVHPWGQPH